MIPTPTFILALPSVPQRAVRAKALAEQTGGTVVWAESGHAITDWRRMLARIGDGSAVCLEDDVRLAPRWRERVQAAVAEHGDTVIQFFSLRRADLLHGSRYLPGRTYLMNQCYYLPPGAAAALHGFAAHWDAEYPQHPTGMDTAIGRWLAATGQRYWLHVPSLVQHENWTSTIHPRRPRTRRSPTFEEAVADGQRRP